MSTNIQSIIAQLKTANIEEATLTRKQWYNLDNEYTIRVLLTGASEFTPVMVTSTGKSNWVDHWIASFDDMVADDWDIVSMKAKSFTRKLDPSIKVESPFYQMYKTKQWYAPGKFPQNHLSVKLIGNEFTITTYNNRKMKGGYKPCCYELGLAINDFVNVNEVVEKAYTWFGNIFSKFFASNKVA